MDTSGPHRLDVALVERGLAESRARAQALIAAGLVRVGGDTARSASQAVRGGTEIGITGRDHPWASRGGLKLAAALDAFEVGVEGRIALDAGASHGGFTDVLLSRGAARVYAVDVGHGQLDARLAQSERVTVMDRTNLRLLREVPGPAPSLVTLDLSFISLRLVLPQVVRLAVPGADVVALVKPQFELGREAVGSGGIVRDPGAARSAAVDLLAWSRRTLGAPGDGPVESPITGQKGNHEWLVRLRLPDGGGR
ncbi:MAG TPA: TlyA family RNA methyltransferase [Candidatus Dormibacteraeota bacterium]|nr:TlyA family RNA methyltransferase [Candidatus Dormibacteraeota bacterium]